MRSFAAPSTKPTWPRAPPAFRISFCPCSPRSASAACIAPSTRTIRTVPLERDPNTDHRFMNEPIHIDEASFERAVLKSPVPVLVDFWAPWCGPCKMISPVLDELARERAGTTIIAKVNVDDNPALAQRFKIRGIPALLFFKDGELREQISGAVSKQA